MILLLAGSSKISPIALPIYRRFGKQIVRTVQCIPLSQIQEKIKREILVLIL